MSVRYEDPWLTVHVGDCREVLRSLPAESVHCVVTSPPPATRRHLQPVPTPAQQAAFEDRLVEWLVRVNEGWLRRQEAGRP